MYANEPYQLQVDFLDHYLMEAPRLIFSNQPQCILTFTVVVTYVYGQEHDCRWSSKRWNKEVGSWNLASFITTMLVLLGSKFVKFV